MKRARGLTMIELLVALAIGSFVIMGAVFVYSQSRTTYALNEQVARLQENARYALAIMEPDIQLAGNYGGSNFPDDVTWYPTNTPASLLKPGDTAITIPAAIGTCGTNFALYVYMPVQASNNSYGLGCAVATAAGAEVTTADTLTLRRASSVAATAASSARIQIYTNRLVKGQQQIFSSNTAPGLIDGNHEIYDLTFRSYYIATNSAARTGIPTLWRKNLGVDAAGTSPAVLDEEIMPGVEDLQVEFGVDDGDHNGDGAVDNDLEFPPNVADSSNGVVSRWVAPDATNILPYPAGRQWQVVAVRVWLRLRSDTPDLNFTDARTYAYAGVSFLPNATEAKFRRILVSRTIYVRNARIF